MESLSTFSTRVMILMIGMFATRGVYLLWGNEANFPHKKLTFFNSYKSLSEGYWWSISGCRHYHDKICTIGRQIYLSSFTACFDIPHFNNNVNIYYLTLYIVTLILNKLFQRNLPLFRQKVFRCFFHGACAPRFILCGRPCLPMFAAWETK